MPELPEVEIVRQSLNKITKQKIERMDANIKFKNSIKEDLINTKFKL